MPTLPVLPPLSVVIGDLKNTFAQSHNTYRPPSPTAPPYSPITPVMSSSDPHEDAARYPSPPPQDTPQPPPLIPFSESDNSDAIALRSAISILQIQKQQALRDLKTLERQKMAAVADPEAFAADVAAGKVKTASRGGLSVGPILEKPLKESAGDSEDSAMESEADDGRPSQISPRFGPIPGPQNVVRTPPINWAKYHIVGESLDKLHDEQKARPIPGQPRKDGDPLRAPEHIIAAPYNPWSDKLTDSPMRTRSFSKKDD